VTPSDELWIDMAEFDTDMADGIWQGDAAPADSPNWYGRVATLVRVAKSPAQADELAGEDEIVALMRQAVMEATAGSGEQTVPDAPKLELVAAGADTDAGADVANAADVVDVADVDVEGPTEPVRLQAVGSEPDDEADVAAPARPRHMKPLGGRLNGKRPLHMKPRDEAADDSDDDEDDGDSPGRGGRIVRRLVAVKAVAATTAFVVGVTAAAAATGIVTVVVPAARDHLTDEKDEPSNVVDEGGSSNESDSGSGGGSGSSGGCAGEGTACTTADGTRVIPRTPGSGTADDPATDSTDAGTDGDTTETTVAGEGTTTDPDGDTTETTVAGGDPTTDPSPPDTTPTTETPTTEPPTTLPPTTEPPPPVEPTSQSAQGAAGDAGGTTSTSADLVETLAAADAGPQG
jgi:hypothetical protein